MKMPDFISLISQNIYFGIAVTLLGFWFGNIVKAKTKFFPPLIFAILFVIALLVAFNIPYQNYMQGAKYISALLTPATICLAVPLYEELNKLKKNSKAIVFGILTGIAVSFLSVYVICKMFGLERLLFVSLIPKSITTAIGIGLSEELGGVVTLTISSIVLTGNFGAFMADFLFRLFKIEDPLARGIGLGTASHAIGTAKAQEYGELASASAGLSLSVSALVSVVLLQILAQLY